MTTIKFVVRVNRGGSLAPQYVRSMNGGPQLTPNRKLALVMGKFAAEDAIASIRSSHYRPELVTVTVAA